MERPHTPLPLPTPLNPEPADNLNSTSAPGIEVSGARMLVERAGRVSVWVGRFTDESALRSYLEVNYGDDGSSCPFWVDTDTDWFDEDFLEADFTRTGWLPRRSWRMIRTDIPSPCPSPPPSSACR